MDKIKARVYLPTKDWKSREEREITISVSEFDGRNDVTYSASIPAYIYNMLTSEKGGKLNYQKFQEAAQAQIDNRQETQLWLAKSNLQEQYLKKKVESPLVSSVISQLEDLGRAAAFVVLKEDLEGKKKIFVNFNPTDRNAKCAWTGGYMGKHIASSFQFFVGYEVLEPKNKLAFNKEEREEQVPRYYTYIRLASGTTAHLDTGGKEGLDRQPLHMDNERDRQNFVNTYHILDWTQEREDFFQKIEDKFRNLNTELSKFLLDLTNDKVDQLMASGVALLEQ